MTQPLFKRKLFAGSKAKQIICDIGGDTLKLGALPVELGWGSSKAYGNPTLGGFSNPLPISLRGFIEVPETIRLVRTLLASAL